MVKELYSALVYYKSSTCILQVCLTPGEYKKPFNLNML